MRTVLTSFCGRAVLGVLLLGILGGGCRKAQTTTPDDARIANNVYSNAFFGLTLPIPKDWSVANRETLDETQKIGRQMLAKDKGMEKALAVAEKKTFQLLLISEKPVGAPVTSNPSLILAAERVAHMPGIKTGEDYLFHATKLLTD